MKLKTVLAAFGVITGFTASVGAWAEPGGWQKPKATPTAAPTVALTPDAPLSPQDENLKNAVLESFKKSFPKPEAWQQKILDEDVLPHYQRFIRDYRKISASELQVDVDHESLKSFVAFRAPSQSANLLAVIRAEVGCPKCSQSLPEIKKLLEKRLSSRGYTVVWPAPAELALHASADNKAIQDRLTVLAQARNQAGAALIRVSIAPPDELDTAHADEKRYRVQEWLLALGPGSTEPAEGNLEIADHESIETATDRLLTDAFTQLGAPQAAMVGASGSMSSEMHIEVSGLRGFEQYSLIREKLRAAISSSKLSERTITRGLAVFAVQPARPAQEIKQAIQGIGLESGEIHIADLSDDLIRLEIKP